MPATLYALKPRFQALLRPLVGRLAAAGITANEVTVAAAAGSVAVGAALWLWPEPSALWAAVPIWLFVRMALNAVDGMLAREHGQKSPAGPILNELGDVVSDAALYLPFALLPPFGPIGIGLVVLGAALTEMAGVLGPTIGAGRRYDGPMGKSDRAFVFGLLGFWAAIAPLPDRLAWVVPVLIAALVATVMRRARGALAEARVTP